MEETINPLQEVLTELENDMLNPELIKDNKLHFNYKNTICRVIMPSQLDYDEANSRKYVIFSKLVRNQDNRLEKDLKKDLKENQNVDIVEIEKKLQDSENEMLQTYYSLAKKKDTEIEAIKFLKDKLETIRNERKNLVMDRAKYLAPSIEAQSQEGYYKYLTSCCTEKLIQEENKEEKWERIWKTYEDYCNDRTLLPLLALGRFTELTLNV